MVGTDGRDTLTACLIVRDEQARLPGALASVAFCDEIIVVDSGSRDRTVELARAAGAKVVENPWPGFGAQRNVAIDHATSDWIIEIDADERISPQLREELERFLATPPPDDLTCCAVPLRHHFLGGWLGPSGRYPLYRQRVFRRGAYRHDEARLVHEGLWPRDWLWALRGDLEHNLADTWSEALRDMWSYARLESGQLPAPGNPARVLALACVRPAAKLIARLIVYGGWRDGWRGLTKITLDCVSDSITVLRAALRLAPGPQGPRSPSAGAPRVGPVRIAVIAFGDRELNRALPWIAAAQASGADIALLTDRPPPSAGPWLNVWTIPYGGPLHLLRALDALTQQRVIDQLVLARPLSPRRLRILPPALRGAVSPVTLDADPTTTVRTLTAATRILSDAFARMPS